MKNFSLFWLFGLLPISAAAHDMWLETTPAGYVLQLGHRYSDHTGESVEKYPAEAVKGALCVAYGGARQTAGNGAAPYMVAGPCAAVVVEFSSGYWTDTPYGHRNVAKSDWGGGGRSWLSVEYVKHLEQWRPAFSLPLTAGLELSPQQDPLHAAPGDKLRFVLSFDGKPVEGAMVSFGGGVRGSTDREGGVNLRIRARGPQYASVTLEKPDDDGKADVIIRTTTLQWTVE